MADWDANSPQLSENLQRILRDIADDGVRRIPTVETARVWHQRMMDGLDAPVPRYIGQYRGEAGLEGVEVRIFGRFGVPPDQVADSLGAFERRLQAAIEHLDAHLPPGKDLTADELKAVIDLCAWAHAEWVRVHPFANGNGRTARLWANFIAMRYDLPPFVRPRPRPGGDYGAASAAAMTGDWKPTVAALRRMYLEWIAMN